MKRVNLYVMTLILVILSAGWSVEAQEEAETADAPAVQQPKVRDWTLRFGLIVAESSGSTSVTTDPGSVDIRLGGGGGGFALLERKVSPLLGLEFGTTGIGLETNVSTRTGLKHYEASVDFVSMSALTFGANFHFVRTPDVIVYAGPMLAYNRYSKWSACTGCDGEWWPNKHDCGSYSCVSVQSRSDSEFTWGAKIGLDIILTKRGNWALSGSLSYMDASYDFEGDRGSGSGSINLDPIMFSFGGGFRF